MNTTYAVGDYRSAEPAVMAWSRSAKRDSNRRAALFLHGASTNAAWALAPPVGTGIVAALAEAGYPTHAGNYCASTYIDAAGGCYNWGNSDHVAAIASGVKWLASNGAKIDKLFMVGASMGALGALNWAKANPSKVGALGLIIPVLDLNDLISNDKGYFGAATNSRVAASMYGQTLPQGTITLNQTVASAGLSLSQPPGVGATLATVNVYTSNGWQKVAFTGISGSTLTGCTGGTGTLSSASLVSQGYGATTCNAYGATWPGNLSGAQLAASSPVSWAEQPGGLPFPVKIWSSDNDPIASNTAACQTFSAAVAAADGGNITPVVASLGATSHLLFSFPAIEVAAFFDANGGRD